MIHPYKAALLTACILLGACTSGEYSTPAPPKVDEKLEVPLTTSNLTIPIAADLQDLAKLLNEEVPTTLWTIDRKEKACVPGTKVKGIGKVTPDLGCRLVGAVSRGPITLQGDGKLLRLRMPVAAEIHVKDVALVLSETATGTADVNAKVTFGMTRQWEPTAKIDIEYDWLEEPGMDILGKRFTFTGKADPKLAQIIQRLERDLPKKLKTLHTRQKLNELWQQGFTVLDVNSRNPQVWLRVTPQQLGYGGYTVRDGQLLLLLNLEAKAETFLGDKPENPLPVPLPPMVPSKADTGFRVAAPVIADYAVLEPVLKKALDKLAAKPIAVPALGDISAQFGDPTIYATEGSRLAIGVPIKAKVAMGRDAKGTIWLTGTPRNQPNSPLVEVVDLVITGQTDNQATDTLVMLMNAPVVRQALQAALTQDFGNDLRKLQDKIDLALTDKRFGPFVLNADFRDVSYGKVRALGQGAYLPVEIQGQGDLSFSPLPPTKKP